MQPGAHRDIKKTYWVSKEGTDKKHFDSMQEVWIVETRRQAAAPRGPGSKKSRHLKSIRGKWEACHHYMAY